MDDEILLLQSLLSVKRQHLRQYERHTAALQLPYVAGALRRWRDEVARLEAHLAAVQRGIAPQVANAEEAEWFYVLGFHWRCLPPALQGPFCPVCYGTLDWGRVSLRHAPFTEWSELQGAVSCRVLTCQAATPLPLGILLDRSRFAATEPLLFEGVSEAMVAALRQEAAHEIKAILRQREALSRTPVRREPTFQQGS